MQIEFTLVLDLYVLSHSVRYEDMSCPCLTITTAVVNNYYMPCREMMYKEHDICH